MSCQCVSSVFEGLHLYCGFLKSCGLEVFVSKRIVSKRMLAMDLEKIDGWFSWAGRALGTA